jgi:hypothetical protein
MLLLRLLHALSEQPLEFSADVLGLAFKFVEELALFVTNDAVGEEHAPQPGSVLAVDPSVRQDVILDGLVEKLLEGRRETLHAFVQLDEEIGVGAVDLAVAGAAGSVRARRSCRLPGRRVLTVANSA